jgi:uncharacterized protein YbjT (DUF2867 family)
LVVGGNMTGFILIVGTTGTVGSELLKQFAAAGRQARALVRDEQKAASIAAFRRSCR